MSEPKDDFEQFIAEMADAHTMYPSDRVWAKVQQQLPEKKSWPALWVCAGGLLLLTLWATYWLCTPIEMPQKSIPVSAYQPKLFHQNSGTQKQQAVTAISSTIAVDSVSLRPLVALVKPELSGTFNKAFSVPTEEVDVVDLDTDSSYSIAKNTLLSGKAVPEKRLVAANRVASLDKIQVASVWEMPDVTNNSVADKWQYEIHAAPSIGFRLMDEDATSENTVATKNGLAGANNAAATTKHKAMLGTEFGLGIQYKINRILSLKTGIQLNVQQADVGNTSETMISQVATSVLQQHQNDTSTDNNRVYQLSIPVGIQVLAISGRHWTLSAGASLLPTYTLGGSAIDEQDIISSTTAFKPISNAAPVWKKWNINTSFDARFSYRIRAIQLYVGPQVRYQHFANASSNIYLPREMKVDYGCRVGIVAPL